MEEKKRTILVPWDFTQLAEYALEHAARFSDITGSDIALIHVVKKEKEIPEATKKLQPVVDSAEKKFNKKPTLVVREGNIFTTITDVVSEVDAELVVMGTHGIKGMQKFTGSWALKVIAGTTAPFVVVQAPPRKGDVKNVVFPIHFKTEDKEKLAWAYYLSKLYNTKIQICKPDVTDGLIKKKTTQNLIFAKKFLEDRGIDYEITTVEGVESLSEATIKFAKKIDTDLILIVTTKEPTLQDFILGADEQKIIANNAKIPVMCVNPNPKLRKFGGFS